MSKEPFIFKEGTLVVDMAEVDKFASRYLFDKSVYEVRESKQDGYFEVSKIADNNHPESQRLSERTSADFRTRLIEEGYDFEWVGSIGDIANLWTDKGLKLVMAHQMPAYDLKLAVNEALRAPLDIRRKFFLKLFEDCPSRIYT